MDTDNDENVWYNIINTPDIPDFCTFFAKWLVVLTFGVMYALLLNVVISYFVTMTIIGEPVHNFITFNSEIWKTVMTNGIEQYITVGVETALIGIFLVLRIKIEFFWLFEPTEYTRIMALHKLLTILLIVITWQVLPFIHITIADLKWGVTLLNSFQLIITLVTILFITLLLYLYLYYDLAQRCSNLENYEDEDI